MSRTTVILPAYNEEARIYNTLNSLPEDLVDPIVVVNGSTDKTAEIARGFGAKVLELENQGKLPAIQETWRQLGNGALEPTIILDADNQPIFSRRWASGMTKAMLKSPDTPAYVGGPVWFTESGFLYDTLRSVKRLKVAHGSRKWRTGLQHGQLGPNTGVYIKNKNLLDELIDLPHYWPGEDRAMMDAIVNSNGNFYQPISPGLMTFHPASVSFLPLGERLRRGHAQSNEIVINHYSERGAQGSRPYYYLDYFSQNTEGAVHNQG